MATTHSTGKITTSTTFVWKRVKVSPAPQAQGQTPKGPFRWCGMSRWNRKEKVSLTVVYRGGAESWWLVTARGRSVALPGWMALEDVMAEVCSER